MRASSFSVLSCCAAIGLTFASPAAAGSNLNSTKSNAFRFIASAADETACRNAGGLVVMDDGRKVCQLSVGACRSLGGSVVQYAGLQVCARAAEAAGSGSSAQEGVTVPTCWPSASGDPLKGLNVGGGKKGNCFDD